MKAFTDINQSKKLAEILPIESADMWWDWFSNPLDDINGGEYSTEPLLHKPVSNSEKIIPCWSLPALLELLPYPILSRSDVNNFCCKIFKGSVVVSSSGKNAIDACYEMILKLNEQKLL